MPPLCSEELRRRARVVILMNFLVSMYCQCTNKFLDDGQYEEWADALVVKKDESIPLDKITIMVIEETRRQALQTSVIVNSFLDVFRGNDNLDKVTSLLATTCRVLVEGNNLLDEGLADELSMGRRWLCMGRR